MTTEKVKTLEQELALLKVRNDILKEFNSEQEMLNEKLRIQASFADQQVAKLSEELTLLEEGTREYESKKLFLSIALRSQKELNGELEKQTKLLEKQKETQEAIKDLTSTTAGNLKNMAGQMGLLASETDPFVRQFKSFGNALQKSVKNGEGLKGALKGVGKGIGDAAKDIFSFSNMMGLVGGGALETSAELINADKALVQFGLSASKSKEVTRATSAEFIKAGGSVDELATAFSTLSDTSGLLAKRLGPQFANRLALLNKTGLDTASSTEILNEAMIREGMTAVEAQDRLGDLVKISRDLGEPVGKAAKEFTQFGSQIKKVGPAAVKEFAKLKAISASTGVEISKLISISEGFTTFEDAARATQQLNLVLGTNLSSVQLMNMSESERVETIQRAIRAQGGLESLNQHQIRLLEDTIPGNLKLTEIMGLQNEVSVDATDTTKDNNEELNKQEKQFQKVMSASEAMAANMKASTLKMGKGLAKFSQSIGGVASGLSTLTTMIGVGLVSVVSLAAFAFTTFGGAMVAAGPAAALAGEGIAVGGAAGGGGLSALAAGGTAAIPVLLTITGVILGVGAAIALVVSSVALLVNAISGAGTESLLAFGKMMANIAMAVNPIGIIFLGIEKIVKSVSAGIVSVANAIGNLMTTTKGFGLGDLAILTAVGGAVATIASNLDDVSLPKLKQMNTLVNSSLTAATGVGSGGGAKTITVNLTLDGKVLDRKIISTTNGALVKP